MMPTIILDVTAEEADKLLATYDAIGGMAGVDRDNLNMLLNSVSFQSQAVEDMLSELASNNPLDDIVTSDDEGDSEASQEAVPEIFMVFVDCETEQQQAKLIEDLLKKGYKCRAHTS